MQVCSLKKKDYQSTIEQAWVQFVCSEAAARRVLTLWLHYRGRKKNKKNKSEMIVGFPVNTRRVSGMRPKEY